MRINDFTSSNTVCTTTQREHPQLPPDMQFTSLPQHNVLRGNDVIFRKILFVRSNFRTGIRQAVRQAPVICMMAPPICLGAWSMALMPFELLYKNLSISCNNNIVFDL